MQPLFGNEQRGSGNNRNAPASLFTKVLGFIGSAIICWILLMVLAPMIANAWGVVWITNTWVKVAITGVLAAITAVILTKIEGTIWGRYYVIIAYLFSLGLVVWIVLRLLHYV